MRITIELEQTDIACASENDFQALSFILQTYAKIVQTQLPAKHLAGIEEMARAWMDSKLNCKNESGKESAGNKTETSVPEQTEGNTEKNNQETKTSENPQPAENTSSENEPKPSANGKPVDREKICKQIQNIVSEKGVGKKVKEILIGYGVSLGEDMLKRTPDDKLSELLEKVKVL